jgi:hypothetical protein
MTAVTRDGFAYYYASDILRNDKGVLTAAVLQNASVFQSMSDAMRNVKDVVMAAVANRGSNLVHSPRAWRADKEVVMAAVTQDGYAFRFASAAMKNDKEVVMAAVTQDGRALEYASDELLNDKCFVLSMKMIRIRRRYRWRRLVTQSMKFKRHDDSFEHLFEPVNFIETVDDAFLDGDEDVGPQPSAFWNAIINKRRKLDMYIVI